MKPSRSQQRLSTKVLECVETEHVKEAVSMLIQGYSDHKFAPSTDYDLLVDWNTRLPPKAVFGIAAKLALGYEVLPKHFTAGDDSICFKTLRRAGFSIIPKDSAIAATPEELSNDERDWAEGKKRLVTHLLRERARGLAQAKKIDFKQEHGKLYCEKCGLDPVEKYGTVYAESCIEIHHHTIAHHEMEEDHRTSLRDLRCLCANCHRLEHRILRELNLGQDNQD